ncbi:MAG: hypothetical protein JNK79_14175 [Chitinophagaceae bacterium]|nr:hypothetical protein [Chitinophagaceae bacterium]
MTSLKRIFGRKDVYYACFVLAILLKLGLYLHFFQLEGDKLFQAIGGKNLVEGNGLTFEQVHAWDLSTSVFQPLDRWPPGFSLLLAPFYALTHNVEISCLVIDFISIVFFFVVLGKLLHKINLPVFVISLLLLYNGAVMGAFISKPTDFPAAALILYTLYLTLTFTENTGAKPLRFGIVLGLVNSLPLLLRYMYLPCVFVVPLILIWAGYTRKEKRISSGGLTALVTTCVITIAVLFFQKTYTGQASYIFLSGRRFYPENLLEFYPFITASFVDINFVLLQLGKLSGASYMTMFESARILDFLLLAILMVMFLKFVIKRFALQDSWDVFITVTGVLGILICGTLSYLSLTNDPASTLFTDGLSWTFVAEPRFFLLLMIVLPLIAAHYLFKSGDSRSTSSFKKAGRGLFYCLVFFQVLHTGYFLAKRFYPLGLTGDNVLITSPVKSYLEQKIQKMKETGADVVMTSNNETVSNWATLNGEKGILNIEELNSFGLSAKRPTVLLVLIEDQMLPQYRAMLDQKNIRFEKRIGKLSVFSLKID